MAERRTKLRGLNTELSPNRLPSGTADVALNVTLRNGDLQKRAGFAVLEDDVKQDGGSGILNMYVARFADGDVYVICKIGATLYQRRVHNAGGAASTDFSAISGGQTHSSTSRGWWYFWDDAVFFSDSVGGTKWNPGRNSGVAYKAGLPRPTTGPTPAQAKGGEKDGFYRTYVAYRLDRTHEEGVVSGPNATAVQCELNDPDDFSGLTITNWSTIKAAQSAWEWDNAVFYTTKGDTDYTDKGAGFEIVSHIAYEDAVVLKTQTANAGLNKADSVLRMRKRFDNAGGEPPGASAGCYDGETAVYGGTVEPGVAASGSTNDGGDTNNDLTFTAVTAGIGGNSISVTYATGETAGLETVAVTGTAIVVGIQGGGSTAAQVETALEASAAAAALISVANKAGNSGAGVVADAITVTLSGGTDVGGTASAAVIRYSIPNKPTMVPQRVMYRVSGDATEIDPDPWTGEIVSGIDGKVHSFAAGAGVIAAFAPTACYLLDKGNDGRLWPRLLNDAVGAVAQAATVGTPRGIHALGYSSWLRIGGNGWEDLAASRIQATLEAIPVAQQADAVAGYYAYEDEVWMAVTKTGGTVAQQIIIYNQTENEFWIFQPANLSTAGITAMYELAMPNATPTMLVATDDGQILQYPSGTADGSTDFAAQWRGYFNQERAQHDWQLQRLAVHCGSNCATNLTVGLRSMKTGSQTVDQGEHVLNENNDVEYFSFDHGIANFFQIEFKSDNTVAAQWTVHDLHLSLDKQ